MRSWKPLLGKVEITLILYITTGLGCFGQNEYIISKDDQNRITTKISTNKLVQITLEGSPFYNNPPWQPGRLFSDSQQREMTGEIAYDVVNNEVFFRSPTNQQAAVTPQEFQINEVQFISETKHIGGSVKRRYYEVLYAGKIKLLRHMSRKAIMFALRNSNSAYDGYYRQKDAYFIDRGDKRFIALQLTKASLIRILGGQIKPHLSPLPIDELTVYEIITLLKANQL